MFGEKTFKIGELCMIPVSSPSGIQHAYGIIVRRNQLKLINNFYSVYYLGKVIEHDISFITKIEET